MTDDPTDDPAGLVGDSPPASTPTNRYPQEHVRLRASSLRPHPENPRKHDQESIDESIGEFGLIGTILVQRSTHRILSGHGRINGVLVKDPEAAVDVTLVDMPDDVALRFVLAANKVGERSSYDYDILRDVLAQVSSVDDALRGTGFDGSEVDAILSRLGDSVIELEEQPFEGGYAETPEAKEKRHRDATQNAKVGLREMVLVYPVDDHAALQEYVKVVAEFHSTEGIATTILAGMKHYAAELAADAGEEAEQ